VNRKKLTLNISHSILIKNLTAFAPYVINIAMIDINNITLRIGSKVLLENASAHISDGWKVGLVGANGCGKTSLFRVLRQELETELGDVSLPHESWISYVAQEFENLDTPILDYILAQDKERTQLLTQLESAGAEEAAEIHERLKIIGASSAKARAAAVLSGLGFSEQDLSRTVREFSGGWRMRLALAAALFQPSDILFLDEPTNHLDLEASLWLESHLRKYRGTLLLISHDRHILNNICSHILHFDHGRLVTYGGNYDSFEQNRALQRDLQNKTAEKQAAKRRHLQSYIDRFRYKASKAKQAQSRLKMLEKMPVLTMAEQDYVSCFNFPEIRPLPSPMVVLEDASAGYGDKVVLQKLNLSIVENDRIALLGANGNGKSTFAKMLSGRLPLLNGEMKASSKLKIGYFAQHQTEELPVDLTAAEYMGRLMPDVQESVVRAHLARFGLTQEKSVTQIDRLSGGEKARLLFAVMTRDAPQLLILDEPTNHLDIDGRDALLDALNRYKGAVILITHDFHLIEMAADNLWLVKDGRIRPYDGDIEDYKNMLLTDKNAASGPKEKTAGKVQREQQLARRTEINALKTKITRLENELQSLQKQKSDMEIRFGLSLPLEELLELQRNFKSLEAAVEDNELQWLEASSLLEKLTAE